jgi:hypothetical protein
MNTKRCLLINQPIVGGPGQVVNVYGHAFVVQPNGISAIAEIDESLARSGAIIGRFKIIEDEPIKVSPIPRKDLLTDFGFEIKDLFGTNDINKLYKKIKKFDKNQMILFAETRLNLNLPDDMSNSKMVNEISNAIKLQSKPPKFESKATLDDLNELESKLNKNKG